MRTRNCCFALFTALTLSIGAPQATRLCAQGTPPPGHPPVGGAPAAPKYAGPVLETMNSGGYTYVLVDTGTEKVWAAGSQFEVKVGDRVSFNAGLPMANFHSKTLNRDFEMIYFTGGIKNESRQVAAGDGADQLPEGHPDISAQSAPPNLDVSDIKKVRGGKTIEEVFADKSSLAGKEVKVRGKVVKFSPQVMGKNWIHLKDGTGNKGTDDLTVTTEAEVKVGDVVVITGKVAVDKDFGYTYQYPVMIEEAKVKVE